MWLPIFQTGICLLLIAANYTFADEPISRSIKILDQLYTPDEMILVVAHRGDWRNAPENSIKAITNCVELGVDIVEVDIRMTKDSHFVLMHDKTLDRTTTGTGKVSHHTLKEIKQLYLKNGYGIPTTHRVPTLEEALEAINGRALLYLDKSEYCLSDVLAIVQRLGYLDQVLLYGTCTRKELEKQLDSRLGLTLSDIHYLPKVYDGLKSKSQYIESYTSTSPAFVMSFKKESSEVLSSFSQIKNANRRIWASSLWPDLCAGKTDDLAVDEPDKAWGWLIDKGATIICTDRPALLIDYLRLRNLHE